MKDEVISEESYLRDKSIEYRYDRANNISRKPR